MFMIRKVKMSNFTRTQMLDPHIQRAYTDYLSHYSQGRDKLVSNKVSMNPSTLLDFRMEQVYKLCGDTANYGKVKQMYKPLLDEAIENDYDSTKIDELFIKSLYLLDNDLDNYFKQTMSEIDVIIQASV
jgi:hypothetical protein